MRADRELGGGLGSFGGSLPLLAFGALGVGWGCLGRCWLQQSLGVSFKTASPQDLALPSQKRLISCRRRKDGLAFLKPFQNTRSWFVGESITSCTRARGWQGATCLDCFSSLAWPGSVAAPFISQEGLSQDWCVGVNGSSSAKG